MPNYIIVLLYVIYFLTQITFFLHIGKIFEECHFNHVCKKKVFVLGAFLGLIYQLFAAELRICDVTPF